MSLSDALQSSYRAFMGGRELKGAFLDGVERSWGQVEVARNLFTNPNLVGDGTYAEVRRNLVKTPVPDQSLTGWGGGGGGSVPRTFESSGGPSVSPDAWVRQAPLGSNAGVVYAGLPTSPHPTEVVAGQVYTLSIHGILDTPGSVASSQVRVQFFDAADDSVGGAEYGEWLIHPAGTWQRRYVTLTAPAEATKIRVDFFAGSPVWNGGYIGATAAQVESGQLSPYSDGNTTPETAVGVDQPEDFRWRWLGEENASESVMEGERVAGFTNQQKVVAIVSTYDGKPAMRMIATDPYVGIADTFSYVNLTIPPAARTSGTVVGTRHTPQALTGPTTAAFRGFRAAGPIQDVNAPNEAGSFPLGNKFTNLTSAYTVSIGHGGAQGSGDVWWTDIGLFAGEYDGEAFSGDTPDYGRDTYTWDGERNNSPSIYRRYE